MQFKTIKEGDVVTEPGAYHIDMEWYHNPDVCPGPSISSTGIRTVWNGSLHAFWKSYKGNPNRYPDKPESDALILGKAAHALILGDEVFDEKFIYVPKDAPRRPTKTQIDAYERDGEWSEKAKPNAEYWEAFDKKAEGRMMLTESQVEKIMYMSENIAATPEAVEVLTSEFQEISMIWQDEITGLWIKSRPDVLPTNGFDFGDLKTFAPKRKNLPLAAQQAVTDNGYHIQMALAIMGAERTLGITAERCALVFVETVEPYEVIPVELDERSLGGARSIIRDVTNRIAEGFKTGEWPGVQQGYMTYSLPPYEEDRINQMILNGELPNE